MTILIAPTTPARVEAGRNTRNAVGEDEYAHMTAKQYWAKMDQIFDSKSLSPVQKIDEFAKVLKTGYDENLDILCVCNETKEGQAHQMYVNLDEDKPLSVGNRYMLCYTGHSRAIHDTHAPLYPKTALILEVISSHYLITISHQNPFYFSQIPDAKHI